MLSPAEETIIRRAARAERAYWQLVSHRCDDARHRLALHDRYIAITRELRGQPAHLDAVTPVDCWIPLDQAVRLEIKRRYPKIRVEVAMERERRRLAVNCGYTQLGLGTLARLRRKLRRIIWASNLSIREISVALGVSASTLERHLGGACPNGRRRDFYGSLESVTADGDYIVIAIRRAAPTRKKAGWRAPLHDDERDEE